MKGCPPASFEQLAVVGVGLLGGSFALACRRLGLVKEIVGIGRSRANLDRALELGILDRAGDDLALLTDADLVVLATPVSSLARLATELAPILRPGALVTDVGSVKGGIVEACEAAFRGRAAFVGSHPIAGGEQTGAAAARADLFRGGPCVVTPTAATSPQALAQVVALWRMLGMSVTELPPAVHDAVLSRTSHLPHLLAFVLARLAGEEIEGVDPLRLAGPSLLEGTRIAASSPEIWRDILLANSTAVLAACEAARLGLEEFARAVEAADGAALTQLVEAAGESRRRMLAGIGIGIDTGSGAGPADDEADERLGPAGHPLQGSLVVPGDKSIGHRALLFGAIADGETRITGLGEGEDNASTIHVLRSLGVHIERHGFLTRVHGRGFEGLQPPASVLDCGNSGTTMRLMAGVLAGRPFVSTLRGDASLEQRPMARVAEPLAKMGARIESQSGRPPLLVHGSALHGAAHDLKIASAQVKTAILIAGLQATGVTRVQEPVLSRDHSERLLPGFGVRVRRPSPCIVEIEGSCRLHAAQITVPGDPSAAAFWAVAASIVPGSHLLIENVSINPTRSGALDVLLAMGARIEIHPRGSVGDEPIADLEVFSAPLSGVEVAGETMVRAIDEFPTLVVAAAFARGRTEFRDGAELRVKESDRIAAMARGLKTLGVKLEERPDGLGIEGCKDIGSGEVEAGGDHRIAMAFAVAALRARGPVRIRGLAVAAVSDPGFVAKLRRLAGLASGALLRGERA